MSGAMLVGSCEYEYVSEFKIFRIDEVSSKDFQRSILGPSEYL
jgi:hypothetical protein